MLSDGLWRRDFGADPDIVGKTVEINNYPLTVVGVADRTFHGTIVSYDVEVFIPVMMAGQILGGSQITPSNLLSDRRAAVVFPHGYLRPGTTLANAAAQTAALWAELSRDRPLTDAAQRLNVVPFRQSPTGGQTYALPTVVALSAMGMLVLLIACANIAGLVLVRALSRRGEIAVRLALGAIGAAVGIVAALGLTRLLGSVLFGVSATDAMAFAQALAIVLGGVIVATIVPAWRAARTNPLRALRHQ